MADVVAQLVEHFSWNGPLGVTFPGVVRHGVIHSAANVDHSWIGTDADALFTQGHRRATVHVVNDADAAGLAEVRYGAGRDRAGRRARADVRNRHRVGPVHRRRCWSPTPSSATSRSTATTPSTRPRQRPRPRGPLVEGLGRAASSGTCETVVKLFSPELIILGGGASRKADKWLPHIDVDTEVVPAALTNEAGIVGAALVGAMAEPLT